MKLEIDIPYYVFDQIKRENTIKNVLNKVDFAVRNGVERPHGEWKKTPKAVMGEGYMWYCNKCEHQVYQDSSKPYPSENFCPNCGASMRKEGEQE